MSVMAEGGKFFAGLRYRGVGSDGKQVAPGTPLDAEEMMKRPRIRGEIEGGSVLYIGPTGRPAVESRRGLRSFKVEVTEPRTDCTIRRRKETRDENGKLTHVEYVVVRRSGAAVTSAPVGSGGGRPEPEAAAPTAPEAPAPVEPTVIRRRRQPAPETEEAAKTTEE